MEKKLSPKKIEANRRNAQRSTGPRTRAGKRNVRWNAVKHGLLSDEVVLPVGEVQERPQELVRPVAHLRRDLTIRQLNRLQQQRKGLWPWGAPQKSRNKATQVV